MTFTAPEIDYAGLSPVIALTAGLVVVLMAGLFRTPGLRFVPALTLAALGDRRRALHLAVGRARGPGLGRAAARRARRSRRR